MASTIGSSLHILLIKPHEDDQEECDLFLSFMLRLAIYVIVLALAFIIVSLIVKCLGDCGTKATIEQLTASETNLLIQKEGINTSLKYGTYEEVEDVEGGGNRSCSEELYDGKICAICYERRRDCLFIPCGHYATCNVCARRIIDGESKSCPLCRTLIRKLKILFAS